MWCRHRASSLAHLVTHPAHCHGSRAAGVIGDCAPNETPPVAVSHVNALCEGPLLLIWRVSWGLVLAWMAGHKEKCSFLGISAHPGLPLCLHSVTRIVTGAGAQARPLRHSGGAQSACAGCAGGHAAADARPALCAAGHAAAVGVYPGPRGTGP